MDAIIRKALTNSYTYKEYRNRISELLAEGKSSGDSQSDELAHYSLLNETRMNRLEKTIDVSEFNQTMLSRLKGHYTWLVISEGWCGDAAQILPIIDKLASESNNISLRIVFRDENEDLMNLFLTNGAKSIPKLIILDSEMKVLGQWGARPNGAAEMIMRYKAEHGKFDEQAKVDLQKWYLHDKGISTQKEIIEMMLQIETKSA